MVFTSSFFIFNFLPVFLLTFFLCGKKNKNAVLLLGSLLFYFWGEPIFCFVAICSAIFDFLLVNQIHQLNVNSKSRKTLLIIGVISNLSLLIYYKYTNFILLSISQALPNNFFHFDPLNIILPIGVSFIVFEKITYLVDVYRNQGKPAKSIMNYLNYVFLFPKLLAGPIIKYHEIESQLETREVSSDEFMSGLKRFLLGLSKKVFIADTCGEVVNQIFDLTSHDLTSHYAWIGILCFTIQIYFDFSAYSDMALGLARILGFKLRENFNMPYISVNFTDFWRRWHISLSTWIREYLYIPLGGNRLGSMRAYTNLWICFLLSGIWHGANWTFVLWGIYNGMFLVFDKLFWIKFSSRIPNYFNVGITFFLVMMGWVIFRSADFNQMEYYFSALFSFNKVSNAHIDITPSETLIILMSLIIIFIPMFPRCYKFINTQLESGWRIYFNNTVLGGISFLTICKMIAKSYTVFLYFKF